jgi:hypothetical protein
MSAIKAKVTERALSRGTNPVADAFCFALQHEV